MWREYAPAIRTLWRVSRLPFLDSYILPRSHFTETLARFIFGRKLSEQRRVDRNVGILRFSHGGRRRARGRVHCRGRRRARIVFAALRRERGAVVIGAHALEAVPAFLRD